MKKDYNVPETQSSKIFGDYLGGYVLQSIQVVSVVFTLWEMYNLAYWVFVKMPEPTLCLYVLVSACLHMWHETDCHWKSI